MNLTLALTFVIVFCVSSAVLYRSLVDGAMTQVRRDAMLQAEMAMAVRKYTMQDVRPLLPPSSTVLHPQSIPAYAANRTMALLEETRPLYRYVEVALNPTNPVNRASGWQVDAINAFRADSRLTELTHVIESPSGDMLYVARPVRPTAECIGCHGAARSAPASLLQRYGAKDGFGWTVGEAVGAQIVSVPTTSAIAQARDTWWRHVGASLLVFGTLFLVLNRILSRTVIAPIETSSSTWRELATKDPLTGARNRRSFEEQGQALVTACSASGASLALVAVDIDHFKRVNDSHGHDIGDAVLKEFAQRVLLASKRRDCLYRIGGEEFAMVLPHTDLSAAVAFAEVLRRSLEATPFGGAGRLTASFGVAVLFPGDSLDTLLKRADRALYAAKNAGRNQVVSQPN
ncbi:GGDEF domain-containing protein [Piscinibacter sp.]|uniref:GGDEF domain-containing protein n=1 Tax=Piscinibacter sp. TaxID=1903157 RepID=UPI002D0F1D3A|nr:diguanylate cyclase [Albitalea sp.]HUG24595.1 diguanylate cyclase [Albitalea sp.]